MGAKPGHSVSPETRARISASLAGRKLPASKLRGRKQNPEHVAARAAATRRWPATCQIEGCERVHDSRGWCSTHYRRWRLYGDPFHVTPRRAGSDHPNWKGDGISYSAVHLRAQAVLPRSCAACGATDARLEVALRHDAGPEHLRDDTTNGPYSVRLEDYVRLCVTCHRRYDSPRAETRRSVRLPLDHAQGHF